MVTNIVGSNFSDFPVNAVKSQDGYGQNGYGGPSSLTPNDAPSKGQSGFLPGVGPLVNDQLRKVKADPYPTTFGNKNPNARR